MKALVCYIVFLFTILSANAQGCKIDNYLESLAQRGAKVSVARITDKYRNGKRYSVYFDNESILQKGERLDSNHTVPVLVDSIRLFLDGLSLSAVETYRYCTHKMGTDTISYSLSLKAYGEYEDYIIEPESKPEIWYQINESNFFNQYHFNSYDNSYKQYERSLYQSLKGKNRRAFMGAKEFLLFDYVNNRGNIIYMRNQEGTNMNGAYDFHIESFDSLLNKLMAEVSVRKYSVEYIHKGEEGLDKNTSYYFTDGLFYGSDDSHSKGTLYIINSLDEARKVYSQLFSRAERHMDEEHMQSCVMEYSNRHFSLSGIKSMVKLQVNNLPLSSYVIADMSKDGKLSILRLEIEGEYWIPKEWKKVKSYIKGKVKNI